MRKSSQRLLMTKPQRMQKCLVYCAIFLDTLLRLQIIAVFLDFAIILSVYIIVILSFLQKSEIFQNAYLQNLQFLDISVSLQSPT